MEAVGGVEHGEAVAVLRVEKTGLVGGDPPDPPIAGADRGEVLLGHAHVVVAVDVEDVVEPLDAESELGHDLWVGGEDVGDRVRGAIDRAQPGVEDVAQENQVLDPRVMLERVVEHRQQLGAVSVRLIPVVGLPGAEVDVAEEDASCLGHILPRYPRRASRDYA